MPSCSGSCRSISGPRSTPRDTARRPTGEGGGDIVADGRWMSWVPYVPVAERRQDGARNAAKLRKQGRALRPVVPSGRGGALATTFWGRAWCDNLAAYAALSNRLDRG